MKKYMSVVNFFSVNATRCCNETVSYSNLSINSINKKRNYRPCKELTFRLQERGICIRGRELFPEVELFSSSFVAFYMSFNNKVSLWEQG